MRRGFIATLALASAVQAAVNDNAAEFRVFCDILGMDTRVETISITLDTAKATEVLEELAYLNLTAASDEWLKDKNGELADENGTDKKTERQDWETHVKKLTEKDKTTGKPKYTRITSTRRKTGVAAAMARAYSKAILIKQEFDKLTDQVTAAKAKATSEIKSALYGDGKATFDKGALESTPAKNCQDEQHNKNAGKCVAWDFLCLCTASEADGATRCAHGANGGQLADPSSLETAKTAFTTIKNSCPQKPANKALTADEIFGTIASFESLLGRQSAGQTNAPNHYIFGKPHSDGTCNGSNAEGMCVNYKTQLSKGGSGIHWLNNLAAAAETLRSAEKAVQEAKATEAKLTAIQTAAWTLYDDSVSEPAEVQENQQPFTNKQGQEKKETDATCEAKGIGAECKPPCKVEGTGKDAKCTLDEEEAKKLEEEKTKKEDGKANTNTTGSNTFVTHKAPLLLAFLLF
uniref:Variant surface glycoprotein n=1 Tax=Trypanosoma equiperdum TaxID=5694 RepID=Q26984_TRYEQ|nr:variant surface glycoprotein [Trypanosoma equiperdum]